jgi:hypothetical protein
VCVLTEVADDEAIEIAKSAIWWLSVHLHDWLAAAR